MSFLETQLVPYKFRRQFPGHHFKVVQCLAPSRTMAGPGTITIRARRLEANLYDAFYSPVRWWQRAPKIERLDRPLHWLCNRTHYRWARQSEILATEFHLQNYSLGDDVRVIAYSTIDKGPAGHEQINCYVRQVLYCRADDPLDCVTHADATCIALGGPPVRQHNIVAAADNHARYLADIEGRAKGWEFDPRQHRWRPPGEIDAEIVEQDRQREWERRARARG